MTSEQQRLHEQHKARLARIQNNAVRPPDSQSNRRPPRGINSTRWAVASPEWETRVPE